ncbi:methyltransferase domain-containing protein [Clostridium sp. YIM B02505]|uniref:Methyltransferase domain-containing protein n=1 Tax=Clostridium yunnanense TaxID=2800325 RepID=A0ABS1EPI6_9CLOT|nr:class I SAM-dependent methyltransferase [Clostridium yunnanense]MBK1811291.1 methyltransferase domain-containing protein [Clostridium yunnanense]
MNTTWSDFIQTTESLYVSRSLRFRLDNKEVWLPLMKVSENMNVLEVGCAGGFLLHQLKQILPSISANGIDRDDNHINYARLKTSELGLDCKFAVGDAVSLPFDDNTFDLTFSHTVIEHVPPQLFLREQYRVLKPGGIITVMSTRHKLSLLPKNWHRTTQFDEAWKESQCFESSHSFEKYEMAEDAYYYELEKCGFKNVDIQFCTIVDYAPDNHSVTSEMAEKQIKANRLYALESIERALRNNPDCLSARERKRLEKLIDISFDERINKYRRGEKVCDIAASTVMFVTGRKGL